MYRTRDQVAAEFIDEGRRQGITPRGIVICIATGLVESNLTVYANRADPESMNLPHDAVGSDANSVGPLQQRAPWWGSSARERMDPTLSSRLFYRELARLPYQQAATDVAAGRIAQQVQKSAFPDRYVTRMPEAQRIYDRLAGTAGQNGGTMPDYGITKVMHGYRADTPANATGNSNGPRARTDFVVIHTQEGDGTAVSLANYLNSNDVSYNLVVDGTDTVEVVPVGEGPWAAAQANDIGVHICFAGSRAAWSREQWLARGAALDRAAKAAAAACQQYGIPVTKILNGSGWNGTRGLAAHGDFGVRGGGHTDPGPNFPWDDFVARVKRFTNPTDGGGTVPTPETQLDRIERKVDWLVDQLGPNKWTAASSMGKNADGDELTVRDGLAELKRTVESHTKAGA